MRSMIFTLLLALPLLNLNAEERKAGALVEPVYQEEEGLHVLIQDDDRQVMTMAQSIFILDNKELFEAAPGKLTTAEPINTFKAGEVYIQKLLTKKQKIEAYAHMRGWFIYCVELMGPAGHKSKQFQSGFAIKAGTTKVVSWPPALPGR